MLCMLQVSGKMKVCFYAVVLGVVPCFIQPSFAGGGGPSGNSTMAGNYTAAAALLSTLRNTSQGANGTPFSGKGGNKSGMPFIDSSGSHFGNHSGKVHRVPKGQGLQLNHTLHTVHNRMAGEAWRKSKASLPAQQRAGNSTLKTNHTSYRTDNATIHPSKNARRQTDSVPQSHTSGAESYVQTPRGYKLETRRQRKRREAGDVMYTPVYSHNFTKIGDNCGGHYRLVEDIDLTNRTGFPLCTQSYNPFRGSLKSEGHTIQGLHVNNTGAASFEVDAGLFGYMNGATVDVHLVNPRVIGRRAGALAAQMDSDNQVHIVNSGGYVEGISDVLSVSAGMVAGLVTGDDNWINQTSGTTEPFTVRAFPPAGFFGHAGGGLGNIRGRNNTLIQTGLSLDAQALSCAGGGAGCLYDAQNTTLRQASGHMVVMADLAGGGVGAVVRSGYTHITQTDVDLEITGFERGAGIGATGIESHNIMANLISGTNNDNLSALSDLSQSKVISGLVDTAGYPPNNTQPSGNMLSLNTTRPQNWTAAQQAFCEQTPCDQSTTCHYPNEQLHTLVPVGNDSLLLVSRQRYPFNAQSDQQGLVRMTRLNRNGTELRADDTFGHNGTRLYSPSDSNTALPPPGALVGQLVNGTHLITLYASNHSAGSGIMSLFPMIDSEGGSDTCGAGDGGACFQTASLAGLAGEAVLMTGESEPDNIGVWMRSRTETCDVLRYSVVQFPRDSSVPLLPNTTPTVQPIAKNAEEYNLYVTDFPDSPVVGLGADKNWLYIARRNQTDITLERFDRVDQRLDCQATTRLENVPEPASNTTDALAYNLKIHNNQVLLVPRQTLVDYITSGVSQPQPQPQALRVELPQYGGCAQWQTQPVYSVNVTQHPDNTTPIALSVVLPIGAVGAAAGITIGAVACKYRKELRKLLRARKKACRPEEHQGVKFDTIQQAGQFTEHGTFSLK